MREFLGAQVQTELSAIYVISAGRMGIQVHAERAITEHRN
jgi:hypothetical protein